MTPDLIQQFHENAKDHFDIDYADKDSVRKGNEAIETLFEIADKLKRGGNTHQLIALLEVGKNKEDLWAAHILLERLNAEGETANKALNVIERYANSDSLSAYGEKLWLEQWQRTRK